MMVQMTEAHAFHAVIFLVPSLNEIVENCFCPRFKSLGGLSLDTKESVRYQRQPARCSVADPTSMSAWRVLSFERAIAKLNESLVFAVGVIGTK